MNHTTITIDHGRSYERTVEGVLLTPSVVGNKRMTILVNDADYRTWNDAGYGGDGTPVTDLITGATFTLARADCGAGCMCASKVVA